MHTIKQLAFPGLSLNFLFTLDTHEALQRVDWSYNCACRGGNDEQ